MARAVPAVAASDAAGGAAGVVTWSWGRKAQRGVARAAIDTLVAAMADDPVNAFLLGGTPSAKFAKRELKGFVKALPKARQFIATPDAAAVALWQLLPEETPRNELLAGWTRCGAVGRRGGAAGSRLCRVAARVLLCMMPAQGSMAAHAVVAWPMRLAH